MGEKLLVEVGIDSARLDAQLLLGHVLNISRLDIILEGKKILKSPQWEEFFSLIARRLTFEPIAYILAKKEFYGYEFLLNQHCLIPRPDTECVLEGLLKYISKDSQQILLDLCTGSGAIGLSALKERQNISLVATDISLEALEIARLNAISLKVADRAKFLAGDLFKALPAGFCADYIVSNPPYIAPCEINSLAPDVRYFEPIIALSSLEDSGLGFYKNILSLAPKFLKTGGFLVLEMGFGQLSSINELIGSGWKKIEVINDLGLVPRALVLQKN